VSVRDRKSQNSAAPAETWEPLYDWWHKTAYRGAPKPTASQENDRKREFLKMVKKCDCGVWHLEMGVNCKGCEVKDE
jgi:hypothetical protein